MKALLLVLAISACGGAKAKPAPGPEPTPGRVATPAPSKTESALPKEIAAIDEQNATNDGAIRDLETSIQALDDSEDDKGARREQLKKLAEQRNALVKTVTDTRDRAKKAATKQTDDPDLTKQAEGVLDHAERSLRHVDDLKTQLATIAKRL